MPLNFDSNLDNLDEERLIAHHIMEELANTSLHPVEGAKRSDWKGAKVLVVSDIGSERSHSTEVRKVQSEATRLRLGRRGAKQLD